MRKRIRILPALLLLLLFAACGGKETPVPAEPVNTAPVKEEPEPAAEPEIEKKTAEASEPQPEPLIEPEPAPEPEPESEPAPQPPAAGATLEGALACVGQDINALYAAIGTPLNSHYEYSCSGPGDDGVLYYDGFLVFTYKENGVETVLDAEAE